MISLKKCHHITDDDDRLAEFKRQMDEIPVDHKSAEFQAWVSKGSLLQFGYLYEVFWTKSNEFLNQAEEQEHPIHPSVLYRIGNSTIIVENMKHEMIVQICNIIHKSLYFGSTFTTRKNGKRIPISTTMWKYGGKALMEDLGLDVSAWDQMVSMGQKTSILLNWEHLMLLKKDDSDHFYVRFRAPEVIYEEEAGQFCNFKEKWINQYCDDIVLQQNSVLHLPSDMIVSHLVHIVCPVSDQLKKDSAWHMKVSVLNAEYVVQSYSFQAKPCVQDFELHTRWNRRLNVNDKTFGSYVDPYLNQVIAHVHDIINKAWKMYQPKETRWCAVKKHQGIDDSAIKQLLAIPDVVESKQAMEENKQAVEECKQAVKPSHKTMVLPPLEEVPWSELRQIAHQRKHKKKQKEINLMEIDESSPAFPDDDVYSAKSDEFGDSVVV